MDPAVDGESEARLATVPTPLKASDPRGHPDGQSTADLRGAEQEDDCFFDCEEMLHGENASPDAQKESLTPEEGAGEGGVETETLKSSGDREEVGRGDESVSGGGRTEERGDEVKGRGGELAEGWNEDDERWEEVAEEKGADSDSELKEEVEAPEFDEEHLRELEKDLTEEEKESRREESMALKEKGNGQFKSGEHEQAEDSYTAALGVCPVCCSKERSILFSNRAAARLHLDKKEKAISDCTKAIELNPNYVRAILRRAELYEKTDKLDEALDDYKAVLERDPSLPAAREACMRLPRQIEERNEKLKDEMMSKLKDLGNMFLRPFGLSTSNFQVNQDSGTGSYSVNFVQNPNNNNR